MKLKILWMYHNLMDLYGDKGNIEVLRYRAKKRGIEVLIDTCNIGEKKEIEAYDLFFLGGGADREQSLIFKDLLDRKDDILQAMKQGTAFLLICGGYQLFGKYYLDQDGNRIDGLGIYDYYTESTDRDHRCIGNIVIETVLHHQRVTVVGFENHGGQTRNVSSPFGKVIFGHGNTFSDGVEGFMNTQTIATYMHGPLLPKNPIIADEILRRALRKNYGDVKLASLDDDIEMKAHAILLKRFNVK